MAFAIEILIPGDRNFLVEDFDINSDSFPGGLVVKNPPANAGDVGLIREIPSWRKWQPTLVFLPGEFHGQRSLAGYSPWDCKELDKT